MQNTVAQENICLSCLMNSTERCAAMIAFCELQNFVREKPNFFLNPNFVVYSKARNQLIALTVTRPLIVGEPDHQAAHRNLPKCNCRDSSVGIATCQGLTCPGIENLRGRAFTFPPGPTLRPTQPSVQWVPDVS